MMKEDNAMINIKFQNRWLVTMMLLMGFSIGCTTELHLRDVPESNAEKEVTFLFYSSIYGEKSDTSSLKSNEMGDSQEEASIKSLTLFYEEAGGFKKVDFDYSSESLVSGLFSTKLNLPAGTYTFYAVANATESLKTQLSGVSTLGDLKELLVTDHQGDAFKSPFIMFGQSASLEVTSDKRVSIRLTRLTAKLEVQNETKPEDNFQVHSIQLFNGHNASYLVPREKTNGTPDLPSSFTPYDGVELMVSSDGSLPSLYTFEAFDNDVTDIHDPLYIILKASYKGEVGYYRIDVTDYRGRQWIRRNGKYVVSVKHVSGYGYQTLDEAKAGKATNLTLGIAEDGDQMIEAGGEDFHYLLFDGEYYLALSKEKIRFTFEEWPEDLPNNWDNTFLVETNAPSNQWSYTIEYEDPSDQWFTVKLDDTDPSKLYLYRSLLPSNQYDETWNFMRHATLSISVKGRPNLRIDIPVIQEPIDSYFNNFDVQPSLFISLGDEQEVYSSQIGTTFQNTGWYVKRIYDSQGIENPTWLESTIMKTPLYHDPTLGADVYQGNARIAFNVAPLPKELFYREGYVVLSTVPFDENFPAYTKTVRIVSGVGLDYDIIYPANEPRKTFIERSKEVIETSLYQTETQTYTVNVRSSMKWEVKNSHDWIVITQPSFVLGSYNSDFTVTLEPNPGNGEDIGGLKKAREGYIDIIGDEMTKRIMVYQGGYVQIGNDIWMDRNLQKTVFRGAQGGSRFNYTKVRTAKEVFYDSAIPIGHPGDVPANYAYGTKWDSNLGKFGFNSANYFSIIPQHVAFLYSSNEDYNYYNGSSLSRSEVNDGYFGWGAPGTLIHKGGSNRYYNSWNLSYDSSTSENVMDYPVRKGYRDPCPEGWRVPSFAELFNLSLYISEGRLYHSGVKDLQTVVNDGDINNGIYFYNDDKVSCWFPFSGYRESPSLDIIKEGTQSAFNANFSSDQKNAFRLSVRYQSAFLEYWHSDWMHPLRCIKNTVKY